MLARVWPRSIPDARVQLNKSTWILCLQAALHNKIKNKKGGWIFVFIALVFVGGSHALGAFCRGNASAFERTKHAEMSRPASDCRIVLLNIS